MWGSRPAPEAADATVLADLLEADRDRFGSMLFTATPREELDEIGRAQQLMDAAWALQVRAIVAAWNRASDAQREFAGDEVALACGVAPLTGSHLVAEALALAALPGLVDAVEAGLFTARHARAVLRELDKVTLTSEQRQAVVLMVLHRYDVQTPRQLEKLVTRLVLLIDLTAAQHRQDKASTDRHLTTYPVADGQGALHAVGPLAQIAAVQARLAAELKAQPQDPSDTRSREAREFDLLIALLTSGSVDGETVIDYQVDVIVPFSTAVGGDLELAEIPGYGPILPSTARDLMDQASALTQVSVDEHGRVIAVSNPLPNPLAAARQSTDVPTDGGDWDAARAQLCAQDTCPLEPMPLDALEDTPAYPTNTRPSASTTVQDLPTDYLRTALPELLHALTTTPTLRDLSTHSYRLPAQLVRLLER
ncbi:MAG: endonuclease, partial [Frankiales bacterium]|nr:endonuclease [Frankiales bacterium]